MSVGQGKKKYPASSKPGGSKSDFGFRVFSSRPRVKADSIWFQKVKEVSHWQQVKKSGDSKALEAYQQKEMGERDAWQFGNQLSVKIISSDALGPSRTRTACPTKLSVCRAILPVASEVGTTSTRTIGITLAPGKAGAGQRIRHLANKDSCSLFFGSLSGYPVRLAPSKRLALSQIGNNRGFKGMQR